MSWSPAKPTAIANARSPGCSTPVIWLDTTSLDDSAYFMRRREDPWSMTRARWDVCRIDRLPSDGRAIYGLQIVVNRHEAEAVVARNLAKRQVYLDKAEKERR